MKQSLRAKRMARAHRRNSAAPKLNLTSLMDIFTILVFFLMVNSSEVQVLQNNKAIKLPDSVSEKKPRENLVVMVSGQDILVQGRKIADVPTLLKQSDELIKPLERELKYQASRKPEMTEQEKEIGRAVTIMGDQSVPYKLLKRVMNTCAQTDFRNMSLAVNKVAGEEPDLAEEG